MKLFACCTLVLCASLLAAGEPDRKNQMIADHCPGPPTFRGEQKVNAEIGADFSALAFCSGIAIFADLVLRRRSVG